MTVHSGCDPPFVLMPPPLKPLPPPTPQGATIKLANAFIFCTSKAHPLLSTLSVCCTASCCMCLVAAPQWIVWPIIGQETLVFAYQHLFIYLYFSIKSGSVTDVAGVIVVYDNGNDVFHLVVNSPKISRKKRVLVETFQVILYLPHSYTFIHTITHPYKHTHTHTYKYWYVFPSS